MFNENITKVLISCTIDFICRQYFTKVSLKSSYSDITLLSCKYHSKSISNDIWIQSTL